MVTADLVAVLIYAHAAVGIAVEGKAGIELLVHDKSADDLKMGGAAFFIDIEAVGAVVDDGHCCAQSREKPFGVVR